MVYHLLLLRFVECECNRNDDVSVCHHFLDFKFEFQKFKKLNRADERTDLRARMTSHLILRDDERAAEREANESE